MCQSLAKPKHTPRLGPIRDSHRKVIEEFLRHIEEKLVRTVADYHALGVTLMTPDAGQQLQFFRHQLATVRWLISLNHQRRRHVKMP